MLVHISDSQRAKSPGLQENASEEAMKEKIMFFPCVILVVLTVPSNSMYDFIK